MICHTSVGVDENVVALSARLWRGDGVGVSESGESKSGNNVEWLLQFFSDNAPITLLVFEGAESES